MKIIKDKRQRLLFIAITALGISSIISSESLDASLVTTISGAGTFGYMAPESLNAIRRGQERESSTQDDIFSLGTLLYELLTQGDLPTNERRIGTEGRRQSDNKDSQESKSKREKKIQDSAGDER